MNGDISHIVIPDEKPATARTVNQTKVIALLMLVALGLVVISERSRGQQQGGMTQKTGFDSRIDANAQQMLDEGRRIFRYETFGDETYWSDKLKLHRAIAGAKLGGVGSGLSPKAALSVGLKVDMDALPADLVEKVKKGEVNLDDPATTLALIKLDSVLGVKGTYRQPARSVVVAGYAVETPRLLLNSSSSLFPDGLANSSGLVGKCFMVHTGEQVFARFPERINQYKAPPPGGAITEHFNGTMSNTDFICGYTIEVVGPHPVDFAARLTTARGMWGADLRRTMLDYNYYAGLGIVGETLPQIKNMVRLHETERDRYGLPVAHVIFSYHENDKKIVSHAKQKMSELLEAAGREDIWTADRTAHLLGTCRMGKDPRTSVVDADCRAHDVPNLFICDGSVFTTSTGVNPSLTIEAIAARTADRVSEIKRRGEN